MRAWKTMTEDTRTEVQAAREFNNTATLRCLYAELEVAIQEGNELAQYRILKEIKALV